MPCFVELVVVRPEVMDEPRVREAGRGQQHRKFVADIFREVRVQPVAPTYPAEPELARGAGPEQSCVELQSQSLPNERAAFFLGKRMSTLSVVVSLARLAIAWPMQLIESVAC